MSGIHVEHIMRGVDVTYDIQPVPYKCIECGTVILVEGEEGEADTCPWCFKYGTLRRIRKRRARRKEQDDMHGGNGYNDYGKSNGKTHGEKQKA